MTKCKKHRTTSGRIVIGGCSHYFSGKCRLEKGRKCGFKGGQQCYLCCPFLNSMRGKEALDVFNEERGISE
jgi:hypothetical protein